MVTKKKPSAAQIAARKLFGQRAKAGTLRKNNPVKPSRKSKIQSRALVKKSVLGTKKPVSIYTVDSSKNGKDWRFFRACYTSTTASKIANEMASEYSDLYWRVKSEMVL